MLLLITRHHESTISSSPITTHVIQSPFGARCHNLHDQRIASKISESNLLLQCKQFPVGANIFQGTEVYVDVLYKSRHSQVNHGSPFGELTIEMMSSLNNFRSHVCGFYHPQLEDFPAAAGSELSSTLQQQRECIRMAIALTEGRKRLFKDKPFRYRASHILYDCYSCMQVQARKFKMGDGREIIVREIAFGQEVDGKTDLRPALYFDISDNDINEATEEEIKRLKRTEQIQKKKNILMPSSFQDFFTKKRNSQGHKPSFPVHYIRDGSYQGLDEFITKILWFELSSLEVVLLMQESQQGVQSCIKKQQPLEEKVSSQLVLLEQEFRTIKRHLDYEHWPRNNREGCGATRYLNDLIPKVETNYEPAGGKKKEIWDSFISSFAPTSPQKNKLNTFLVNHDPERAQQQYSNSAPSTCSSKRNTSRLLVLQQLSSSQRISSCHGKRSSSSNGYVVFRNYLSSKVLLL